MRKSTVRKSAKAGSAKARSTKKPSARTTSSTTRRASPKAASTTAGTRKSAATAKSALPPLKEAWIRRGLDAAIAMAEKGWREGGIPIGSSLLDEHGNVVAAGHNQRVQSGDPTAHAEVDCIRRPGRRRDWRRLTLVSTLSPCCMCSGTTVLFKIPRVVIGENITFQGAEKWMKQNGVELIVRRDRRCIALMRRLQKEKPDLWAEDIGE